MTKQNNTDDRAAELMVRIEKLEAELATLLPPKPARAPYVEEGARIIQHQPAFIRPDDFPTKSQLDSLLRFVLASYPRLGPAAGASGSYEEHFERAFLSLCHIRRRPEIDKRYAMSYWRDLGQDTLASLNIPAKLDLAPFIAATIAHGDVPYSHPNHPANFSMSAGLIFGGSGRAYSGAWKQIFDAGKVNPPVEIFVPKNVMPHNVRIIGGDQYVGQRG